MLYFKSTCSGPCRWDPGENKQKPAKSENSYPGRLSKISALPGWERKVKFYVVLFFPNPDSEDLLPDRKKETKDNETEGSQQLAISK